ncbi:MAG: hypothetical protein HOW73_17010 [Polyangiaceae bacterium]|nr:hypothetical protein [Polyangiaceae bacterium]
MSLRAASVVALSVFALAVSACGDGEETKPPPGDDDELLAPPPAGEGTQFRMVTTIEAGSEVEHCQFFRAPPEGLNVNSDEIRFTGGSHHVLLYLTPYSEIPTENEDGMAVDTSKPFDCSEGATANWQVDNLIAGSQNGDGGSIVDFPEGVAMKVPGNAVLLMNVHYINAQSEPIEPEVRVNVYTLKDEDVVEEGGVLFWYDPFIRVDAKGTGLAKLSCPLDHDVKIRNAQSHMHRRGVDYEATVIDPEGARTSIYKNTYWEGVPVERWEDGLDVAAGSRIEYFCGYQNPEDRTVWQGPRTTDEMCMFIASYWPAKPETSLCATDAANIGGTRYLAADWIGAGEATCAQTLGCVQGIEATSEDSFMQGLTDCVIQSAPEESSWVSEGVRCLLTHPNPAEDCGPEIQACLDH